MNFEMVPSQVRVGVSLMKKFMKRMCTWPLTVLSERCRQEILKSVCDVSPVLSQGIAGSKLLCYLKFRQGFVVLSLR